MCKLLDSLTMQKAVLPIRKSFHIFVARRLANLSLRFSGSLRTRQANSAQKAMKRRSEITWVERPAIYQLSVYPFRCISIKLSYHDVHSCFAVGSTIGGCCQSSSCCLKYKRQQVAADEEDAVSARLHPRDSLAVDNHDATETQVYSC